MSFVSLFSHALPHLEESNATVAVVSSMAGLVGLPKVAPYAASKHALRKSLIARADGRWLLRVDAAGAGVPRQRRVHLGVRAGQHRHSMHGQGATLTPGKCSHQHAG
jgi:NAD(P)-dependent dehydrogenase (short-subunit alcohol dehydrogenase family)